MTMLSTRNSKATPDKRSTLKTFFGMDLEQRCAGMPSGNPALDPVRNRRHAFKGGRTVIAKPRPRGFYHDAEGRILMKISAPMDLLTSTSITRFAGQQDEIEAQDLASAVLCGQVSLPEPVLRSSQTQCPEGPPPSSSSGVTRTTTAAEAWSPTMRSKSKITKGARYAHLRKTNLEAQSRKHLISPDALSVPGLIQQVGVPHGDSNVDTDLPTQASFANSMVSPPARHSCKDWNDYFSPDGTVRTSIIVQGAPTLPQTAYTASEYEYTGEFMLPKTVFTGSSAYHCGEGEYTMPNVCDGDDSRLSLNQTAQLQHHADGISTFNNDNRVSIPEDYDHAFGYLPTGRVKTAGPLHPVDEPEHEPSSPEFGFITIGVNLNEIPEAFISTPDQACTPLTNYETPHSSQALQIPDLALPGPAIALDSHTPVSASYECERRPSSAVSRYSGYVCEAQAASWQRATPVRISGVKPRSWGDVQKLDRTGTQIRVPSMDLGYGKRALRRRTGLFDSVA